MPQVAAYYPTPGRHCDIIICHTHKLNFQQNYPVLFIYSWEKYGYKGQKGFLPTTKKLKIFEQV